jgi:hypothetical protein
MVANPSVELTQEEIHCLLELLNVDEGKSQPVKAFGAVIPPDGVKRETQRPAARKPHLPQIQRSLRNKLESAQSGDGQSGVWNSRS